ncbi:MAG TPA: HAD-IA family hydrolase [Terriglobales bacterium]|nr:HAD-IA family hydrolase [Terriglobales bacterium]
MSIEIAFFDVGGVVLSNGWDHRERARAVERFQLDRAVFEAQHERWAPAMERGAVTLDAYLAQTVFDRPRDFSPADFREFMCSLTEPKPESITVLAQLKTAGRARLATLNNEGRELNEYRIARFELFRYFEVFCSSCYLGERKPDEMFYRRALGIVQMPAAACLFVDDREENLAVPRALGMDSIRFESAAQLRAQLLQRGLLG